MTDIVERLRDWPTYWPGGFGVANGLREAAEEIERNRAAIDELVEALDDMVEHYADVYDCVDNTGAEYQSEAAANAVVAAMKTIAKHQTTTKKEQ